MVIEFLNKQVNIRGSNLTFGSVPVLETYNSYTSCLDLITSVNYL